MAGLRTLLDESKMGVEAEALAGDLRARIVGQDSAIQQITSLYQTWRAGLSHPGRPIGSLLFLGPTGSGKTRTVEAVAESLLGDPRAVVKIDCAEFQHSHEIAKLVGSPPGYLGHRETHAALCQEALNQFHTDDVKLSLVLFDEVEKASDALWNLLLGILDKATLTLGDNRKVDFSRALIFMTSNLGAAEMNSMLRPKLGFATQAAAAGKVASAGVNAARRRFTPEFLNRIDVLVPFQPLGEQELRKVIELELHGVEERIANATGKEPIGLAVSDGARDYLLSEGTDARYGARHLKRAIERLVVQPISNLMASGQVVPGDSVVVEYDAAVGRIMFLKETTTTAQTATTAGTAAAA